MSRLAVGAGLILVTEFAAATMSSRVLDAADKKEAYVSTAEGKTLIEKPLPGVDGKRITIIQATASPGWVGGSHYHSGPVYVYVLEGSFTIDERGKARQTFKAGELYEEPIGTPMRARNPNTSKPIKFLIIQVYNEGEPMMYKAQ